MTLPFHGYYEDSPYGLLLNFKQLQLSSTKEALNYTRASSSIKN